VLEQFNRDVQRYINNGLSDLKKCIIDDSNVSTDSALYIKLDSIVARAAKPENARTFKKHQENERIKERGARDLVLGKDA
jgi:hypothetical protein